MKILHIIYDDPKNMWLGGGGAIRTKIINQYLSKSHEITVITGNFKGAKDEVIEGVQYKRIGSNYNYFLSRLTYVLLVWFYIRKIPHDILIEEFSGNSPTFSTLLTNKPTVAIVQNYFGTNSFKKLSISGIIPFLYEKFFIYSFDGFVTPAESMLKHWVGDSFHKKVAFIPQGIDSTKYQNKKISEEYLLYVGRLDFVQKGIDILLASLKLISDLNVPLVIVGGGDEKKLFALIDKYDVKHLVKYVGFVPHDEIINYYAKSFYLCLPSRYEGGSIVCVESYALGKPVLGTDIPGLKDILIHGKTGIKVPSNDHIAFSKEMRRLLTDHNLRHKLCQQAYQYSKDFEWEKQATKQENFYKDIIK